MTATLTHLPVSRIPVSRIPQLQMSESGYQASQFSESEASVARNSGQRLAPEVYRARRLAALSLAFAMAVGVLLGVSSIGKQAAASRGDQLDSSNSITITVMPGDTLWGIAERLDPGSDPRSLVHELTTLAGKGVLQPGQSLVIPNSLLG